MANPEHLAILKQGVDVWNAWSKTKNERIDLSKANLLRVKVRGLDLRGATLHGAFFNQTDLNGTNFRGADLTEANLNGANLTEANFSDACAIGANFSGAFLCRANFTDASLIGATFVRANLMFAEFNRTLLRNTDWSEATLMGTIFSSVNLSQLKGLDTTVHRASSTIGVNTLYESKGQIPDSFLRDAGIPDEIIDIARTIRTGPPIQWHSCFISYSTKDNEFARRLHSRMRDANMRVWFAPEDLKGGKKLHEQLFEAIQINDYLLLVLSEHSIQSEWVMTEIRKARETEKKEKRRKLFPIRLTNFETLRDWTCFDADTGKDLAVELREYFIPDFSNWKNHDAFEAAFARLQEDLREVASLQRNTQTR